MLLLLLLPFPPLVELSVSPLVELPVDFEDFDDFVEEVLASSVILVEVVLELDPSYREISVSVTTSQINLHVYILIPHRRS